MNLTLLWLVTLAYAVQSGLLAWGGQYPGALMLVGFTIGNLGMIWGLHG